MDQMNEKFFQTFTKTTNDESMTSAKSAEDIDTTNPFSCLAGESHDPYEDEENDPTLDDFWDSMTQIIAVQLSSKKGKRIYGLIGLLFDTQFYRKRMKHVTMEPSKHTQHLYISSISDEFECNLNFILNVRIPYIRDAPMCV